MPSLISEISPGRLAEDTVSSLKKGLTMVPDQISREEVWSEALVETRLVFWDERRGSVKAEMKEYSVAAIS